LADERDLPEAAGGQDGADVVAVRTLTDCPSQRGRWTDQRRRLRRTAGGVPLVAGRADRVANGPGRAKQQRGVRVTPQRRAPARGLRALGYDVARAQLHVLGRDDNPNEAWVKSRRQRRVPRDVLTVQVFDAYEFARMVCVGRQEATSCWSTCSASRSANHKSLRSEPDDDGQGRSRGGWTTKAHLG